MRRLLHPTITLILLGLMSVHATAHKASGSYLTLRVEPASATPQGLQEIPAAQASGLLSGSWAISLRDLDFVIGLDDDRNGELGQDEVRRHHGEIAALAVSSLGLQANGQDCTIQVGAQQFEDHTDGSYSVLPLRLDCPGAGSPIRTLTVRYSLFAEVDPQHRGLLKLQAGGKTVSAMLGGEAPVQTFVLSGNEGGGLRGSTLAQYLGEGVWHIWVGFDHILFLLSLLLPAVLVHEAGRWRGAPAFKPAFLDVLKVVTAFTVAHSVTLALGAMGWVDLPARWVESAIAASVILAALNNVHPVFKGRRWTVAFAFGLIHGFAFASMLLDLGLPADALTVALLGFNLGVEVGQLAIVALFLPLAFSLRRSPLYRQGVMKLGSCLIAALAALWLAERALDMTLISGR